MKTDLEQLKDFILNTQTMAEQGECLRLNVTDILNEIERIQALINDYVEMTLKAINYTHSCTELPIFKDEMMKAYQAGCLENHYRTPITSINDLGELKQDALKWYKRYTE